MPVAVPLAATRQFVAVCHRVDGEGGELGRRACGDSRQYGEAPRRRRGHQSLRAEGIAQRTKEFGPEDGGVARFVDLDDQDCPRHGQVVAEFGGAADQELRIQYVGVEGTDVADEFLERPLAQQPRPQFERLLQQDLGLPPDHQAEAADLAR
jgi:hypothetical protein